MSAHVDRARRLLGTSGGLFVLLLLAILATVVSFFIGLRDTRLTVRITAGDPAGRRAEIAEALAQVAELRGLDVEIVASSGSEDAIDRVQRGELDVAMVQGGLAPRPDVREVAPLTLEPLHLFVSERLEAWELDDLRQARIATGPEGSGTRTIATEVLELAGLEAGRDYEEVSYSYASLRESPASELPDAIFHVSSLPSPIGTLLLRERGYRLMPLPIAPAIGMRDVAIGEAVIPRSTYGFAPSLPREDVPTLGTRMLVVAHRRVERDIVRRLLEIIDSEEFGRAAHLSRAARAELTSQPEMALHEGTTEWLHRNDPLLTPELMEGIESFRSFLVSLIVALVLAWRWYRTRRIHGLDSYLAEVSRIDRDVLDQERSASLDLAKLLELRQLLGDVKTRALDAFARGSIHSEELLSSFLTHVSDVRSHLNAMILSERERLSKQARASGDRAEEVMRELWADALHEEHGDRELRASTPPKQPDKKKR